jgi:glycosyltransferase involved in cell wall biosynthesis
MKVAVVSYLLPPSFSGQAMMIYQLFKDVSPDNYCLISSQDPALLDEQANYSQTLPGKYFYLSTKSEVSRGHRFGLPILREGINTSFGAYMRARQIAKIVEREKCEAVMSCSSGSDLLDVPSGFIASRLARVPFYLYLFDTYSHMWLKPQTRFIGRRLEPVILKRARGIITTNESVSELLRGRYGVESTAIHNPCDLSAYEKVPPRLSERDGGEVNIVYTGAVSEAHYEPLRNMVTAIKLLGRSDIKLHIYTAFSPSLLADQGIRGPVVIHEHQPISAMPGIQRQAKVLFLPLAFNSPYPELIKISSPSKMGEFLAARRPILVHAPPDSFISTYFRQHDCGLVIDQNNPERLAEATERLLADPTLRKRLSNNAGERAMLDFSLPAAQRKFSEILKLDVNQT